VAGSRVSGTVWFMPELRASQDTKSYAITWVEDSGWVATCSEYPSLSYVGGDDPSAALDGLLTLVMSSRLDEAATVRSI
jgi:hypothetical protein